MATAKSVPWSNSEVQAFLCLLAEDKIQGELDGATRNEKVFQEMSEMMASHGYQRSPRQCRGKLKKLKADYRNMKDHNARSGSKRKTWKWFEQMDAIYGNRPASNGRESALDTATTLLDSLNDDESPPSPQSPPNKTAKNVSQGEQIVKGMKEFFSEMDKDFEERERLRCMEQRHHEECLRREAKEEEREERAKQMAMFKELLESQNNLLRELLRRLPSPTSQHLTPSKNNAEPETTSSANIQEPKECTQFVPNSHAESPQSPPNKRVKKVSQEEQMVKDMKECFAEIARTLEERERLRLLEQRQHEERLRKEAKEEAQEQRARQMTMFKEMQESQSALLRELLRRMPSPTLQQLNYWHSGNQSRFSTDTAGSNSVQNTSQQDVIFNPHTSTSFME